MRNSRSQFGVSALLSAIVACSGCADEHRADASNPEKRAGTQSDLAYVPNFPGAGKSGADEPLAGGMICDSVTRIDRKLVKPATTCFFQPGQTQPAATIEQVLECVEGMDAVHLRLTLDPAFVDNTYGENAIGWAERAAGPGGGKAAPPPPPAAMPGGPGAPPPPGAGAPPKGPMSGPMPMPMPPPPPAAPAGPGKPMMKMGPGGGPGRGHSWKDLVGSDHAEFVVTNEDGELVSQFKLDYISETTQAPSGYASLGVLGGDGRMIAGDPNDIVQWHTSIERNLNERGYGDYTVDSPETDADYTPNDATPNWDYRVVYEVWIDNAAFGESGFGGALIEHVHASPSKAPSNTIEVIPGDCPCQRDGGCAPPALSCEDTPDDPNCQLL